MKERDDQLCTRSVIYNYYKSLFMELQPYYLNQFSYWADQYNLKYTKLEIIIDETNWGDDVSVIPFEDNGYLIKFPKGLFERLIYLVNLLIRTPMNTSTIIVDAFSDYWKDPDFSFYDTAKYEYRNHFDFSKTRLGPLLHDYDGNQSLYENDLNKFWSTSWPQQEIFNRQNSIPFLWVIDFIIYHEMGHILLRHIEYYEKFKQQKFINEINLDIDEIYFNRHLVELHADIQSTMMLVASLDKFQKASMGYTIDDEMRQNFFNLGFLLQALISYWAKTRTSIKMHENMSHPHPDIRRMVIMHGVSRCLNDNYKHEWIEQYQKSFIALQNSFCTIGAASFGDSVYNLGTSLIHPEWQQKTLELLSKYEKGLIVFTRYVKDFDKFYQK